MNKNLLALLIASSLGLYGCGDETSLAGKATIDPDIEKSLKAETKINFDLISDPSKPIVVTPTFLAMDSTDGTLSVESTADDPTDLGDPAVAMGKTDGWSPTQPFIIEFVGNDLEPTTAADGFFMVASKDPTNSADNTQPSMLSAANGDFVVTTSGTTLTVVLTKPLAPSSNYMFAITNALKDVKGNSVGMSNSYAVLKSTNKPPSDALLPAQVIVQATEKEFDTAGVASNEIIFSSWFTTASAGDVLYAAKSATALALKNGANTVWKGSAVSNSVTDSELSSLFTLSAQPLTAIPDGTTLAGNYIFSGTVSLPYFLEVAPTTFSVTPWQSGMPSLAKIKYTLSNGTDADKAAIATQLGALGVTTEDLAKVSTDAATQVKVLAALTGATLTLADGKQLDTERLITRYSPVPKLKSVQNVEYTLILPKDLKCQAIGSTAVTIFQHGITSSKEPLKAATLADKIIGTGCQAIFAIDHPLHGTRGISGVGSATGDTGKPEMYLNLASLTVARDNLRQSAIDVINLRASIGKVFATLATQDPTEIGGLGLFATLDPTKGVGFVGHSLGAMTGINVGYVSNKSVGDPQADAAFFNFNKLALANPGASISYLLLGSKSFGNFVKGNLVAAQNSKFNDGCKAQSLDNATCYANYEASLIAKGDEVSTATLTKMYADFSQFAYAAQTVLDPIDPITHSPLIASDLPVYLAQVKGDETIPNKLIAGDVVTGTTILQPYSPFGGTLPLLKTMSLTPTTADIKDTTVRNAALFNKGTHSTFLKPDTPVVMLEMQSEVASLLNGDGTVLTVDNSKNILDTTP